MHNATISLAMACWTLSWSVLSGCGETPGGDPCAGVVCNQPPRSVCLDATRLRRYESPGTCDPADGQCHYQHEDRACAQGCADGACVGEADGDFLLEVPPHTALCSLAKGEVTSLDVFELYATMSRVRLAPGTVRLPRDLQSFEADWIEEVQLGPDRQALAPAGPGRFDRTIEGTADDGSYIFGFQQRFATAEGSFVLAYSVAFEVSGGEAVQDRLLLDADALGNDALDFSGALLDDMDVILSSRRYTDCACAAYRLIEYDVTAANGDTLELDLRRIRSTMEQNMHTALTGALFTRGTARLVDDPFRLAYSSYGHNWAQCFLVVLDEPLDTVHGLFLEEETGQGLDWEPRRLHYLDADLAVVHTEEIVDFETRWGD